MSTPEWDVRVNAALTLAEMLRSDVTPPAHAIEAYADAADAHMAALETAKTEQRAKTISLRTGTPYPFVCDCGVTITCPSDPTPVERAEFDTKVAQHRALLHHQAMQRIGLAPADGELPGLRNEAVSA